MSLRKFLSILMISLLSLTNTVAPAAENPAQSPGILVLGDSLSAGYGLDADQGWVHLLKQKLHADGFPHAVINASISGETTAGGLARLPSLLDRHQPQLVLVELGGNDGLRALPVAALRKNLEQIVDLTRKAGAEAVLFEMRIPENYGATYTEAFTRAFTDISKNKKAPLVPFLLSGFATDPSAFLDDGIHPGVKAQPVIVETVWPFLKPLL